MYAAGRQDRAGMAGDWQGTRATADTAATSHGFMHSSHQPPEMSMTVPEVEMMGPQRLELVPRHVEGTLSTLILEKGLFWKRCPRSLWGGGGSQVLRAPPATKVTCQVMGPPVHGVELQPGVRSKARATSMGRETAPAQKPSVCLEPVSRRGGPGEGWSGNLPPTTRRTERNNDGPLAN